MFAFYADMKVAEMLIFPVGNITKKNAMDLEIFH
jgi:hypothetical protein